MKSGTLTLDINICQQFEDGIARPVRAGCQIELSKEDKGYYLGEIYLSGTNFHVEAIEATQKEVNRGVYTKAVNQTYQGRIDSYLDENEDMAPHLVTINKKKYFVHIEPFAQ